MIKSRKESFSIGLKRKITKIVSDPDIISLSKKNSGVKGVLLVLIGSDIINKNECVNFLSRKLTLDVFKVDLSLIVNKYIGETEKNLNLIFEKAEQKNQILFFDEADALFGKRTEVKDSHDRYANTVVNYLLDRVEKFSVISILSTNLDVKKDPEMIRRSKYIIYFS